LSTFHYRAYTAQGVITTGAIVADGIEAAVDALYGSGLTPFETHHVPGENAGRFTVQVGADKTRAPIWKREIFQSNRFSLKELTAFTVELSSLRNSGLPLDAAFRIIAGPGASPKTVRLAGGLLKDVLGGLQLSEAMARRPEVFPSDYLAILGAGESGGATGQVLKQIAELLTRRLELRGKITSALIYPLILILMSLVSVGVIVFVLLPSIAPIFTDAGLPLPGILKTLSDLQENWLRTASVAGVAGIAVAAAWSRAKQNAGIMHGLDRLKYSLPVVGKLIQSREAGRFARALGTLLSARVPMMWAMQTARALVTNRYLNGLYEKAIERVPEGTPLHRAFDGTGLLPATSLRLVAVGEESGQLGPMLIQVATVLEGDLQRRIEQMVGLLTPALTLAIGSGIGALIMQVMTAVLSINDLAFQ
jgi:general secretion pathway protein F